MHHLPVHETLLLLESHHERDSTQAADAVDESLRYAVKES
jgi:hypothetical protein